MKEPTNVKQPTNCHKTKGRKPDESASKPKMMKPEVGVVARHVRLQVRRQLIVFPVAV